MAKAVKFKDRIPKSTFNMKVSGRAKPAMKKADRDFIRGYACCLANAINLEDWRFSQIGGGISIADMELAGVDAGDLKTIINSRKIGN